MSQLVQSGVIRRIAGVALAIRCTISAPIMQDAISISRNPMGAPTNIGENAALIRERVCRDARWLGLEIDDAANGAGGPRISRTGSRVSAWVVPTNEELMIARHTRRLLGRPKAEPAAHL